MLCEQQHTANSITPAQSQADTFFLSLPPPLHATPPSLCGLSPLALPPSSLLPAACKLPSRYANAAPVTNFWWNRVMQAKKN